MPTFDPDRLLESLRADGQRLCFYPSCGRRELWAVMGLEAEVFVFSDFRARTRQGRERFWEGIEADFRRHGQPLQLVKATVRTRVFRCGEKWGFLFFQDNNEVLARIQAAKWRISYFVGICDGCREGGNYECVHASPFLGKLLAAAAMPLMYFADHSELLSYWRHQVGHLFFHRQVVHQQRWTFALQDVLVRPHWQEGEAPDGAPEVNPDLGVYAFVPDPDLRAAMEQGRGAGQAGASPLMTLAPFRRKGQGDIIARYEVTALEKPHPYLISPPITATLPTVKPPTAMQQHDSHSKLWSGDRGPFFRTQSFTPRRQEGPHCVSTVLSMLTGEEPGVIRPEINTQDPVSWSDYLRGHGMKLVFCPTDCRRLEHYLDDLLALDDLFTLSYYSPTDPEAICADPDDRGWVCGSHIVLLHRDQILDPASGSSCPVGEHHGMKHFTKRIFRVVPADHPRGL